MDANSTVLASLDLTDAKVILEALPEIIAAVPGGLAVSTLIRARIAAMETENPVFFSAFHGLVKLHLDQLGTGNINAFVNLLLPPVPSSDVPAAAASLAQLVTHPGPIA